MVLKYEWITLLLQKPVRANSTFVQKKIADDQAGGGGGGDLLSQAAAQLLHVMALLAAPDNEQISS